MIPMQYEVELSGEIGDWVNAYEMIANALGVIIHLRAYSRFGDG